MKKLSNETLNFLVHFTTLGYTTLNMGYSDNDSNYSMLQAKYKINGKNKGSTTYQPLFAVSTNNGIFGGNFDYIITGY